MTEDIEEITKDILNGLVVATASATVRPSGMLRAHTNPLFQSAQDVIKDNEKMSALTVPWITDKAGYGASEWLLMVGYISAQSGDYTDITPSKLPPLDYGFSKEDASRASETIVKSTQLPFSSNPVSYWVVGKQLHTFLGSIHAMHEELA